MLKLFRVMEEFGCLVDSWQSVICLLIARLLASCWYSGWWMSPYHNSNSPTGTCMELMKLISCPTLRETWGFDKSEIRFKTESKKSGLSQLMSSQRVKMQSWSHANNVRYIFIAFKIKIKHTSIRFGFL